MIDGAADTLTALKVRLPSVRVPVGVLSGGQRQGVAIARAVQQDTPIVLLDEPTAALGYRETQQVITIIRQLRDAGKAVVLVSHDLSMVFDVADAIQVMRLGRVQGVRRRAEADRQRDRRPDHRRDRAPTGRWRDGDAEQPRATALRPRPGRALLDPCRLARLPGIVTSPQFMVVVVMLLFVAFGATQSTQFLNPQTWINILRNAVFIAIVASFTTFVFVSGGLDLSVGSLFAVGAHGERRFSRRRLADPAGDPARHRAPAALAGLLNGVLINYASIPPFITTLGMLYAARSLVVYFTGGQPITALPDAFSGRGATDLLGLPLLLFYAAAIVIVAHIVLETTDLRRQRPGHRRQSRGGEQCRHQRPPHLDRRLCAERPVGGLRRRPDVGAPRLGPAEHRRQLRAAGDLGGHHRRHQSSSAASARCWGSLLGSLVLSILTTGLILLHIDPVLQDFVIGVIIVVAVGIDQVRRRRMFRSAGVR